MGVDSPDMDGEGEEFEKIKMDPFVFDREKFNSGNYHLIPRIQVALSLNCWCSHIEWS